MSILGGVLNIDKTLTGLLGGVVGTGTGGVGLGGGLLTPINSLIVNLTGSGTGGAGGGVLGGVLGDVLDLDLLTQQGVVKLTVLGRDLVVLPRNGGIIDTDLLGGGGLPGLGDLLELDGLLGGLTNIIELDGLLGDAGLLNLTGLLDNGVLSLGGLLGEVLKLLSPGGVLTPDKPLDPDGEVDPDAFAHQFIGTSGRDIFTIPAASSYVDGRGNIDIANFARSAEGMSFAVGRDAVVFADGDTLFYLRDVERINFFEGTLLLDTGAGENAGMAYRIYQAAFDRTPDAGGLEFWIDKLDTGSASFSAIANHFIHSAEFINTFGTTQTVSNTHFIELMYTHTLGRNYDRAGLDFWVQRLEGGQMSRADVLAFFAESPENQALVAEQIDNGIWLA